MTPLKLRSKINIVILLACVLLTLLYGVILWLLESHRHTNAVSKVKLLMHAAINQKYEDLANEIAYRLKDALDITFKDMLKIDGVLMVGAYTPSGKLIHASKDCHLASLAVSGEKGFSDGPSYFKNEAPTAVHFSPS